MKKLTIDDLVQFDRDRMAGLDKNALLDLSVRLRDFGIKLYEKLNEDSSNSSKPPSGDDPFKKGNGQRSEEPDDENPGDSRDESSESGSDKGAINEPEKKEDSDVEAKIKKKTELFETVRLAEHKFKQAAASGNKNEKKHSSHHRLPF